MDRAFLCHPSNEVVAPEFDEFRILRQPAREEIYGCPLLHRGRWFGGALLFCNTCVEIAPDISPGG
jgi:hypothetical protein